MKNILSNILFALINALFWWGSSGFYAMDWNVTEYDPVARFMMFWLWAIFQFGFNVYLFRNLLND